MEALVAGVERAAAASIHPSNEAKPSIAKPPYILARSLPPLADTNGPAATPALSRARVTYSKLYSSMYSTVQHHRQYGSEFRQSWTALYHHGKVSQPCIESIFLISGSDNKNSILFLMIHHHHHHQPPLIAAHWSAVRIFTLVWPNASILENALLLDRQGRGTGGGKYCSSKSFPKSVCLPLAS